MKRKTDVDLVLKAAAFAAHKHRHQRRKNKEATPYINHPIAVARLLSEEAVVRDPDILAAALLHDTVEDTLTEWDELRGQPRLAGCGLGETLRCTDKGLESGGPKTAMDFRVRECTAQRGASTGRRAGRVARPVCNSKRGC